MYPPTEKNLAAMKGLEGQRGKLARLLHDLEAGIVVQTTSEHALYIPAGCIHATFTLQGGFLVANDFTTSLSLKALGAYITSGLDSTLSSTAREDCFILFKRCLDVCLTHRQLIPAIKACLSAGPQLAMWADSNPEWRTDMQRLWQQNKLCLDQITTGDNLFTCPCEQQSADMVFSDHFASSHLPFLVSTPEQRARKRRRCGPQ
jgi:hypothetical protein